MGRRVVVTEAEMRKALKVAREHDPGAVIEVTRDGTIRILPSAPAQGGGSDVDRWFDGQS